MPPAVSGSNSGRMRILERRKMLPARYMDRLRRGLTCPLDPNSGHRRTDAVGPVRATSDSLIDGQLIPVLSDNAIANRPAPPLGRYRNHIARNQSGVAVWGAGRATPFGKSLFNGAVGIIARKASLGGSNAMFDTIIRLTGPVERLAFMAVLSEHNPGLTIVPVETLADLNGLDLDTLSLGRG
jgi:hypothetical protein